MTWCYVYLCYESGLFMEMEVQVSVYCARDIPVHLRCTQCSILLHLIDFCLLTCICMWQISQIQTFLCVVVRLGLISTSTAFMRSSASLPAGPNGWFAPKTVNRATIAGGEGVDTICIWFDRPQ